MFLFSKFRTVFMMLSVVLLTGQSNLVFADYCVCDAGYGYKCTATCPPNKRPSCSLVGGPHMYCTCGCENKYPKPNPIVDLMQSEEENEDTFLSQPVN